jgi:hypothetical protein
MSIEEIPILEMEVEDKLEVEEQLEVIEKKVKPEAKKRGRPKGTVKKKQKVDSDSEEIIKKNGK